MDKGKIEMKQRTHIDQMTQANDGKRALITDKESDSENVKLSRSNSFRYTIVKFVIVYAYHLLLENNDCNTANFKFATFLVVTPIAKALHFFYHDVNLNLTDGQRLTAQYMYSLVDDGIYAYIYFKGFIPYFRGEYFVLYPIINSLVLIVEEIVHWKLADTNASYDILCTGRIQDNLLAVIVGSTCHYMGKNLDFSQDGMSTAKSFGVFFFVLILFDFFFGITHYLTHVIPYLWTRHSIHHQYKKESLNAFANFHSDFVDSWIMNSSLFVTAATMVFVFGRYHVSFMDMLLAAGSTHLKYSQHQMQLIYFFEWDAIDMALGQNRVGSFHAQHHQDSSINFCAFGIVKDEWIKKLLSPITVKRRSKKV